MIKVGDKIQIKKQETTLESTFTDILNVLKSSKMKDKLLRYSVPITEEDGTTIVDMRFYNNEIVDLFMILFYEIGNIPINTNYYEVLLSVREKIKKSKMSEE